MGRLPYTDRSKTFQVTKIWNTHQEIIRRHVLGQKGTDIARALGLSPVTVGYTINSPVVKEKIAELQADRTSTVANMQERIADLQSDAIDYLDTLIHDDNCDRRLRFSVAKDILDRGGNSKITKVQTSSLNVSLSGEEIQKIKQRGLEMAREAGLVQQAEVTIETIQEEEAA